MQERLRALGRHQHISGWPTYFTEGGLAVDCLLRISINTDAKVVACPEYDAPARSE